MSVEKGHQYLTVRGTFSWVLYLGFMRFLLTLATLSLSAPFSHAQTISTPALATIDPTARDLLARLDAHYKRFQTFQSVIELRTSEPMPWTYNRIRLQLTPVNGIVSTAIPGQGVEKRVFDGRTELRLDSRYPRVFQSRPLDAERYSLSVFLRQAGVKGLTVALLSNDNLASTLLDPDLKSVSLGPDGTSEGQLLKTVMFQMGKGGQSTSLKLFIDDKNLLLRRVEIQDDDPRMPRPFSFSETYSQIQFDEPLPQSLFSTRVPANFKRVPDFPDEVAHAATSPVLPDVRISSK